MGIVGRYIDALSDEQRDRIIEAEDIYDGHGGYFNVDGCGCLVGVAEMVDRHGARPIDLEHGERNLLLRREDDDLETPSEMFPHLCERFGKSRIVAACKARAAKGNAPNIRAIRDGLYVERKDTVEREGLVPPGGMSGHWPARSR